MKCVTWLKEYPDIALFFAWEAAFLASPVAGFFGCRLFQRSSKRTRRRVLFALAAAILFAVLQHFTRWSFRSILVSALVNPLAWAAYSQITWLATLFRQTFLRALSYFFSLPVAFGFAGGIFCIPALVIANDAIPHDTQMLSDHLLLRRDYYGAAMTFPNEGVTLSFYEIPLQAPIFKKKVAEYSFGDAECSTNQIQVQFQKITQTLSLICPTLQGKKPLIYSSHL